MVYIPKFYTIVLLTAFVTPPFSGKVMQPIVDAGLFVISGVMTCGEGRGYCLLGLDCTLDEEFLPDSSGHCKGLQNAFTPSAYFSCCKYKNLTGVDNFVYTVVDPAVSTLVNSYSDATENPKLTTEKIKLKDATKKEPVVKNDNDIIEEFHKHMENVKLKNEVKEVSTSTATTTTTEEDEENAVVIENTESDSEEESSEEDGAEEQESDEKSEEDDIKTIHLGDHPGDRDEKEANEAEDYDNIESNEKKDNVTEDNEKSVTQETNGDSTKDDIDTSKDKDHMKKVDLGHKDSQSPTITADTVVDNVKQFLSINKDKFATNQNKVKDKKDKNKVAPKPMKTTSRPSVQVNMIGSDDKDQDKVPNIELEKQPYPIYQPQVISEKLCMRKKSAAKCRTIWKLTHQQRTLCAGTMLDQEWMLTSAVCLERIVQVGLRSVSVDSHPDWKITRLMAYEGFRSEYNHTHHDIGLVRLSVPLHQNICVPCIPRLNQMFVGSECTAPFSSTSLRSGSSLLCQGVSEAYHSHGDQFMSLACRNPAGFDTNIPDWNAGNGLICRGYLAGLQTPIRTEQLVYLQINPYVKWIQDSMRTTGISQKFHVGS